MAGLLCAHILMPAAGGLHTCTSGSPSAFFFSKLREEAPASPAQRFLVLREEGQKEALFPLHPPAQPMPAEPPCRRDGQGSGCSSPGSLCRGRQNNRSLPFSGAFQPRISKHADVEAN